MAIATQTLSRDAPDSFEVTYPIPMRSPGTERIKITFAAHEGHYAEGRSVCVTSVLGPSPRRRMGRCRATGSSYGTR